MPMDRLVSKTWLLEHPGLPSDFFNDEDVLLPRKAKEISHYSKASTTGRHLCAVFATGGSIEYMYLAPIGTSDILDVSQLFPNGALSVRVTSVPGTSFKLQNDYRVIISKTTSHAPLNASIRKLFGVDWVGNLVVMKYCSAGVPQDVRYRDTEALIFLIGMWINNIQQLRQSIEDQTSR